jgi:hypothetical protein
MLRAGAKLTCLVALVWLVQVPNAQAQISRQNPYRSFNIGGVNYGSIRWEQQHRSQAKQHTPTRKTYTRILGSRRR